MKAYAPGKLILSGEHAVVYGCPAIVSAVHRRAMADVSLIHRSQSADPEPHLFVEAPKVLGHGRIPMGDLPALYDTLNQRHSEFLADQRDINHILFNDLDLVYYAVALILTTILPPADIAEIQLRLDTDIPIGCGMGSSAAILAATLSATAQALGHPSPSPEMLYEWTLAAERLQHGRPSGVDPYIVTHGGCIRFQNGIATPLNPAEQRISTEASMSQWVMTGTPTVSTGTSVAEVRLKWGPNDPIWEDFSICTTAFEAAWIKGDRPALQDAIRENHRLLCRIGVVPTPVQAFIRDIESEGGSAKICGAGATAGAGAGVVWVEGATSEAINDVCLQYGYRHEPWPLQPRTTA